ncbi:MAG: ATP-binding protein [Nanoarchaeota archaeon]|nr:ATP-binding protein [Nanoarchaeota archaeon]
MIKISPALEVSPFKILNTRTCVLSEKNLENTAFVFCEELLKNGVPFCVIDTKGVFNRLKIFYDVLWVGGEESDINMHYCDFKKLAEKAITHSIPLILDTSKTSCYEEYLKEFFSNMINTATNSRRPYLIIINDSEIFLPETGDGITQLNEIALMKLGRGLGMILLSQKPSQIDKNVLHNCSNKLLGSLSKDDDIKSVNHFFNKENKLNLKELNDNEFIALGGFGKGNSINPRNRNITKQLLKERAIMTSLKMKKIIESLRKERTFKAEKVKERISKDESKNKIRLKKKYVLFGDEIEDIKRVSKVFKNVVEVTIEENGAEINLLFNATTGIPYYYDNTLHIRNEFGQFIELNDEESRTLSILSSEDSSTTQLLKDRTGMKHEEINNALSELMKKNKIIRAEDENGKEVFKTRNNIPMILGLSSMQSSIIGETEELSEKIEVNDKIITKLIKTINPDALIKEMKVLIYPFYKIEIASLNPRTVMIDAVTGIKI